MKIRRLPAAALLATALGAAALTGAAPAVATARTGTVPAAGAHSSLLPPNWYQRGPYPTLESCRADLQQEVDSGVNGVKLCRYEDRPNQWQDGYYYYAYIL